MIRNSKFKIQQDIRLVILGTVGLDDVETPFGKVKGALGGSAVYAATAASFFSKSGVVSIAGHDLPKQYLQFFKERKIDIDGIEFKGKTFRWQGLYEFDMNEAKTIKTELNSLAEFEAKVPDRYLDAKFLFLANTDPILQMKTLSKMRNKPFVVLDTMNYWITSQKADLLKVIKKVDLLVLNEGEARQLFDTPNLIKAGKQALALGVEYVIIKKGEHGALLFSSNGFFSAPGYPLEQVNDPTGAGDSFSGGLIGYLAKTGDTSEKNIRKAIIFGSCVASACAESFSLDYVKKTNLKNIKERYHDFKEIRRF